MRVLFDPEKEDWDFVIRQGGAGFNYPYFVGSNFQRGANLRGAGVGAIFRSLLKFLLPLGKRAGMALAEEGVDTVSRILNSDGNIKTNAINESKAGLRNLLNKASSKLAPQAGGKIRKKRAVVFTKMPPTKIKKRRVDALGAY